MVTTHFMDEAEYCDRIGLSTTMAYRQRHADALKAQAANDSQADPTGTGVYYLINQWDKENGHEQ